MRIVYLTNNIDPKNGWGRYASDLIQNIRNDGHQVTILTERQSGSESVSILRRGFFTLLTAIRIRRYLRECDVVHALDGYPFAVMAAIANLGIGKKFFITCQGTYAVAPLYNWHSKFFLEWAYRRADGIVAISNYTKAKVLEKVSLGNIRVIGHGVDFKKFFKERVSGNENYILGTGALKFRKGYHVSIPAFTLAKKIIPDLKYKIVGSRDDITYFNKLKELADEYKVGNDVEFITSISDEALSGLYQKARLFILTSVNQGQHFEGFGLVFLEAAAAGLPVIGSMDNGISDAVKDGFNGLLVEQGDINGTAKSIIKILTDSEIYNRFSKNSYEWAREHSLRKMAGQYIEFYEDILAKN